MKFTVVSSPRAEHQLTHQSAMLEGLRAHGVDAIANIGGAVTTDYVACWGWRRGQVLRAEGRSVLVMERGYLGNRFEWTSLAWNGLNNRGTFPTISDPSRFKEHFKLQPWKTGGDYVLLMGQVPGDMSLQGRDLTSWYNEAVIEAQRAYALPVKFRPHPLALKKGYKNIPFGATLATGTLEDSLAGAAVVITYNSNSGVDAVIAGVPTVVSDSGSMAVDVAADKVGRFFRPDREQWAAELAWKQWSLDEIRSGFALEHLLAMEPA